MTLLKHLWTAGAQSAREVHDGVSLELGWSYSSTRKTLDRMVAKQMIRFEEMHGIKVFKARIGKVTTIAAMAKAFARDVLGMDGPLPAATFARSQLLDEKELAELEALLDSEDEPQ